MKKFVVFLLCLTAALGVSGQPELIKYGDMDHWVTRKIKESAIIGGHDITLHEIGPSETINGNTAYTNRGGSPWGTSNVMARVSGITKTNASVYREKRGSGYCAKLMTHIEKVKVLGMINIKVLAAGSIFLGDMKEPITSTKDGPAAMNAGIPFARRPRALVFDYRVQAPGTATRIKQTGFSRAQTIEGKDYCIATLYLQRRTEDAAGNITAKRVGTLAVRFGQTTAGWTNGAAFNIIYGDARTSKHYDAELMRLHSDTYARNSKGKSVPVKETGWADADAKPTHLVLQFSSSHGGAYIGTVGNTMWIDNVKLEY